MCKPLTNIVLAGIFFLSASSSALAQIRECPSGTSELFITPRVGATPIAICVRNEVIPTLLGLPAGPEIETAFQEADCPFFFSEIDPDPANWTDPREAFGSNDNESPPTSQCQIRGGGTSGAFWLDAANFADAVCDWQDFRPDSDEFRCSAYLISADNVPSVLGTPFREQVRICTPWTTSIIGCDPTLHDVIAADQQEFDTIVNICFAQMSSLAQAVTEDAGACTDTSSIDTLPFGIH